jgi:hypothetical protein
MSAIQRNDAAIVGVDPSTADVLRQQTLVVLEANHYFFEEILAFGPEAQSRSRRSTATRLRSWT